MIGVCGYGYTGSGAVLDLLKEYSNIEVKDKKEFVITFFPNGIEDLEYHLVKQSSKFYSSDIAIRNFKKYITTICHNKRSYYYKLTDGHFNEIANDYINNLTQISWRGRWVYDDLVFDSLIKKISFFIKTRIKSLQPRANREMYFSIKPNDFYKKTNDFLKRIYNYSDCDKEIVLDQPFPANQPLDSMKLFGDDSKAIIVMRDPRDLYYMFKDYLDADASWVPVDDVNKFVDFYKKQYETRYDVKNIMYIYFEDLIYKYDETIEKIEKFCNIDPKKHINKFKYFNPKKSLKNTKLFIKNSKYDNEIKIIEKEMKEYLYDFSNSEDIDYSNDVF